MKQPTLSIVIPVFNEEKVLPKLQRRLAKLKKKLPKKTELIFVDDGSDDGTAKVLHSQSWPFTAEIIQFSRNFGHQASLVAGLRASKGKYVVSMDGDLQHPPEHIPKMLKLHDQGYDVVLTKRIDGAITEASKKITAQVFYRLVNVLSATPVEPNSSDFRSLNREALNALLSLPENRKFLRGMIQWIGFEVAILPFQVEKRAAGESKYGAYKMMRLALHGLTSFSALPLFLSGIFSLFLFAAAFLYAAYVVYIRFWGSGIVQGWASVLFTTLVIGGFLSFFVGLLGVYVAAIYDEVKGRPEYIVKKTKKIRAK